MFYLKYSFLHWLIYGICERGVGPGEENCMISGLDAGLCFSRRSSNNIYYFFTFWNDTNFVLTKKQFQNYLRWSRHTHTQSLSFSISNTQIHTHTHTHILKFVSRVNKTHFTRSLEDFNYSPNGKIKQKRFRNKVGWKCSVNTRRSKKEGKFNECFAMLFLFIKQAQIRVQMLNHANVLHF